MKYIKRLFLKCFWHNRHQGWLVFTALTAIITAVCLYRPAYSQVSSFINNNLLLTASVAVLLFFKFVLNRIFYISKIKDGKTNARGCANSSCLMTVFMFFLIIALSMKGCRQYVKPKANMTVDREMAANNKSSQKAETITSKIPNL